MKVAFTLSVGATVVAQVKAQPAADLITELPEFGAPPSKHYSGYITGNNNSQLHYYLAEAEDVDPTTAPLVLWTNGGPGCSSMSGWGYELGPFTFRSLGESKEGYPHFNGNMKRNPYAWNKKANVVFLEQPPGVGFSYLPNGGSYATSDTQNQANNYAAIKSFFEKFSNLKNAPFYVAGESYAGKYVPAMAQAILDGDDAALRTRFAGMLVGNGVTTAQGTEDDSAPQVYFQGFTTANHWNETDGFSLIKDGVNAYGFQKNCFTHKSGDERLDSLTGSVDERRQQLMARPDWDGTRPQAFPAPCVDNEMGKAYLDREDVQKALHVTTSGVTKWGLCFDINYKKDVVSVIPTYNNMAEAGKKVLIYTGNYDGAVPWTDAATWIPKYAKWNVTRAMTPWSFNDPSFPYGPQIGGAAMQFQGTNAKKVTENDISGGIWWTTMRGCGHMVPQDCPAAAHEMLHRVLSGTFWEIQWQGTPYPLLDPMAHCDM